MRLPIDTLAVQFMSASPAEPVLDFETKAARLDGNGQPLYSVHLFAISPDSYDRLHSGVREFAMSLLAIRHRNYLSEFAPRR